MEHPKQWHLNICLYFYQIFQDFTFLRADMMNFSIWGILYHTGLIHYTLRDSFSFLFLFTSGQWISFFMDFLSWWARTFHPLWEERVLCVGSLRFPSCSCSHPDLLFLEFLLKLQLHSYQIQICVWFFFFLHCVISSQQFGGTWSFPFFSF